MELCRKNHRKIINCAGGWYCCRNCDKGKRQHWAEISQNRKDRRSNRQEIKSSMGWYGRARAI